MMVPLENDNSPTKLLDQNTKISSAPATEKNPPVDMTFKDVNYGVLVKHSHKEILKNISGVFKSGTMTAILGASGGGKTSLLNVLSGKIKHERNVKLTGEIKANGKTFSNDEFNKFSAYVMQNDVLLETLTAKECLQFAADFKLSGTEEHKRTRVNEVIHALKLTKCQNSYIGGYFLKGISGGERKRVNIGCELITDPSVLFLDEPTSGLDSFTAFIVICSLKEFAKKHNKTVIMSIHSPNTDIWNLFDKIILLVQGRMIYQGDQHSTLNYFKSIGFVCPKNTCIADYLMKKMTSSEENDKNFPILFDSYDKTLNSQVHTEINSISTREIPMKQVSTSFLYQTSKIAKRTFLSMQRNPILLRTRVIQAIVLSVFIGLVYLNQDKIHHDSTFTQVQNKIGGLFLCSMSIFMQSLNAIILSFPAERVVFLKEENSKYYSTFAYLVGRLSLEYIIISIAPIIMAVVVYFMIDLNQDKPGYFFYFFLILLILSWTGNALGLICGITLTNPRTSSALQPVFKLPFILFSGFFKNRNDYASWIGWIQYISPFTYGLEGLTTNEFEGVDTPFDLKKMYDFNIGKWNCFYILIGLFAGFQSLAIFSLYSKRGTLQ